MNIYIIPGYGETMRNQGYRRIVCEAKRKYNVKILNLQLKNGVLSDLSREGIETMKNDSNSVVLGFSTGALIAYFISKEIKVKKGVFCSLTPAIGKDILNEIRMYRKYLGVKQAEEFKKLRYGKTKAKKAIFICGSNEGNSMINRSRQLSRYNKGTFITIEKNDHALDEAYVDAIVGVL